MLGISCDGLASHPGGVAILLVTSIHATETGISSGGMGHLACVTNQNLDPLPDLTRVKRETCTGKIAFGFASDWLSRWREFSEPDQSQSEVNFSRSHESCLCLRGIASPLSKYGLII